MSNRNFLRHSSLILPLLLTFVIFAGGCGSIVKTKDKRPVLLKVEDATLTQMYDQINHLAQINSMKANMDLKFEDNSYAEIGIAEKYRTADGMMVVQRPDRIWLTVQVPLIKSDVAQMTSDGEKFRVAILQDNSGGKYKKFVIGTNKADYSSLQTEVSQMDLGDKGFKQNVNAFSNLRPQHFTDAILMRSIDTNGYSYSLSTILQEENTPDVATKSPLRNVLRGYYLLDELRKNEDGSLSASRRFWFDRVGTVRLARQQIFDAEGEIESDITYGQAGNLGETGEYANLPLKIEVTRPKEKYKMSLTYQSPQSVSLGKTYNAEVFVLKNTWNLEEVDLDQKLQQNSSRKTASTNQNTTVENK